MKAAPGPLVSKRDKFIYGTQFSPDGSALVSVGSDRRIWLYDGKTGEAIKQIGEGEHKGSIFGVSWAPDSKRLATCSGDQTVKVWDVESGQCVQSWRMGGEGVSVPDQQVGVTWPAGRSDDLIISLDLEGNLNYFHVDKAEGPAKVVRGHQKAITSAASAPGSGSLVTGSYEGRARSWDLKTGAAELVDGEMHSNQVSGLAAGSGRVYSVGWDDSLRTADVAQKSFIGGAVKTAGQPKGVAVATANGQEFTIVASTAGLNIYSEGQEVTSLSLPSPPTCVAANGATVASGADDKVVRIYTLSSAGSLTETTTLKDATSPISALAFSPSGTHLATGLGNGKVFAYSTSSNAWKLETNRWSAHTARVTSLSWSPDGTKAVSGSLDTNVCVWSMANPGNRVKATNAHKEGVGAVVWVEDGRVVSCGADAAVKVWRVEGVA
jgi:WD repeat-containing protein 1 (actin-interacting protein 1)